MEITIKIEAEGLEKAIRFLASRLGAEVESLPPVAKDQPEKKRRKKDDPATTASTPESETPTEPAPSEPAPAPDTDVKPITLEAVREKLAELSANGKKEDIKKLLSDFGVAKLTDVEPAKFGELMAAAEAL